MRDPYPWWRFWAWFFCCRVLLVLVLTAVFSVVGFLVAFPFVVWRALSG